MHWLFRALNDLCDQNTVCTNFKLLELMFRRRVEKGSAKVAEPCIGLGDGCPEENVVGVYVTMTNMKPVKVF